MKTSTSNDTDQPGLQRDPDEWKTGDEPTRNGRTSKRYVERLAKNSMHH